MHRLAPILDQYEEAWRVDLCRQVSRVLFEVLVATGAEVLTDHDRHDLGLPPRGPDGWTVEELRASERWSSMRSLLEPPGT
jgi:hypothetical protein